MRSVESFPTDDVLNFRDGRVKSRYLLLHGFPETPYIAFLEKEASEADRLLVSLQVNNTTADAQLSLDAIVEGNDIDIKMKIIREGQPPEYLHFGGASKDIRVGYRSLAG